MNMNRREFIKNALTAVAGVATVGLFGKEVLGEANDEKVVVFVSRKSRMSLPRQQEVFMAKAAPREQLNTQQGKNKEACDIACEVIKKFPDAFAISIAGHSRRLVQHPKNTDIWFYHSETPDCKDFEAFHKALAANMKIYRYDGKMNEISVNDYLMGFTK